MPKDDKSTPEKTTNEPSDYRRSAKPWSIAFFVLLVLAIIVTIGLIFTSLRRDEFLGRRDGIFTQSEPMMRGRHMIFAGNNSTTSNTVFAEGVVTSVGNDTFVVAGNGTQTTVKTNGDTTWNTADKKVSTNDSVVVAGTKSDSTITATTVRVVNE